MILGDLLDAPVRGPAGEPLGYVVDVRLALDGPLDGLLAAPRLHGLLVSRGGARRSSATSGPACAPPRSWRAGCGGGTAGRSSCTGRTSRRSSPVRSGCATASGGSPLDLPGRPSQRPDLHRAT